MNGEDKSTSRLVCPGRSFPDTNNSRSTIYNGGSHTNVHTSNPHRQHIGPSPLFFFYCHYARTHHWIAICKRPDRIQRPRPISPPNAKPRHESRAEATAKLVEIPVTVCSTVVRVDQHRPKHWTTWIRGLEQPQQPHQRLTKNDIHLTSQSSVTRCDDVSDLMPYHNLRPT
ncbi:hypothetical protein ASPTUDRAFT_750010 [Aspergillus tubingensis CBS 134.48]|uniref:Uncharacterized protein n=1 Tax=Aspergillus tubingensis (strain CBS 134.48) TaxID=767770 RepID=A0A1L9MYA6_ASPTC|nr:hypothetical protein ASPTUDRAFT_750010 [Aspergillus tubingensis CBS 134.48]